MSGLIPPNVTVPAGMDPTTFYLQLPAMGSLQIPEGADRTLSLNGPDQKWFTITAVLCTAIPALFLMLRLYTRLAIVRSLELTDYFLFLAFPLIVVEIVMGYKMVTWGAGVHQWRVTLDQLFNQLYWANVAQVIYCPLSFLVKMAILLQYLKLFAPDRSGNKGMWYGSWVTIVSTFIAYTMFMFWTLFYCSPRRAMWFKLTPNGKCHDVKTIILSQGAFNMASDIVILLLPTFQLWQLNVPLAKKIYITVLFATGLLACIASGMRIKYTLKISSEISETDVSMNGLFIGLWTEAELSLAFIVACALCIPKLIQSKRQEIKSVFVVASSPFRFSTSSSKPGKTLSWGVLRKASPTGNRESQQMRHKNGNDRPPSYEDFNSLNNQENPLVRPKKHGYDIYVVQNATLNTQYTASRYSQSSGGSRPLSDDRFSGFKSSVARGSQASSKVRHSNMRAASIRASRLPYNERYSVIRTASIARVETPKRISVFTEEVPLKLDRKDMTKEQIEDERKALQQFDFASFRNTMDSSKKWQTV